jgi:ribonuclease Z
MRLPVVGPTGIEQVVVGFNQAYSADAGYRTAHHGPEVTPPSAAGLIAKPFIVPSDGASIAVWEADEVKITAFAVDHCPVTPSVGYKVEYGGRAVVISGDTRKSEVVAYTAKRVDLLVHEGLSPELVCNLERAAKAAGLQSMERIAHDIPSYHMTPIEAAETAPAARVSALLFTHVVPGWAQPGLEVISLRGVSSVFSGAVMVGQDGTVASMPSGNKEMKFLKFM